MQEVYTEEESIERSSLGVRYIAMMHYILLCSPSIMN